MRGLCPTSKKIPPGLLAYSRRKPSFHEGDRLGIAITWTDRAAATTYAIRLIATRFISSCIATREWRAPGKAPLQCSDMLVHLLSIALRIARPRQVHRCLGHVLGANALRDRESASVPEDDGPIEPA